MLIHRNSLLGFVAIIVISGCACTCAWSKPEVDTPVLQAYLTDECPSEPAPPQNHPRMAPFFASILGLGVDHVLDALGTALANAAKEDKEGIAQTGTVPSYLYRLYDADKLSLESCVVVAIAPNGPAEWCNAPAFSGRRACETGANGKPRIQELLHPVAPEAIPYGKGTLAFYAEIELRAANDQRGLLPVPRALYYPGTVNPEARKFRNSDPRDLSISVSGSAPSSETAMSALHVYFKNLTPSPNIVVRQGSSPDTVLDRGIGHTWLSVAKAPDPQKDWANLDPKPKKGDAVSPINLAVEVREVGKPDVFLQVLAAVFAQEKATIAKDIKTLIPGGAEATTAAGDQLDATSKKQAALSTAYKALAALQAACTAPGNTTDTVLRQDVSGYISARAAAEKVAGKGDLDKLPALKDVEASQSVADYCKSVSK